MPQDAFPICCNVKKTNNGIENQLLVCSCCQKHYHFNCVTESVLHENLQESQDQVDKSWYCKSCSNLSLPFTKLNDTEFINSLCEFKYGSRKLSRSTHFEELHINPFFLYDKYSELTTDDGSNYNPVLNQTDKYMLDNKFNRLITNKNISNNNSFSVLHVNARSLNKSFESFEYMIDSLAINFIITGISETWMFEPSPLISLPNYNFICEGRKDRMGGGVGLYILNNTDYRFRTDLNANLTFMESIFIEIISKNKKNTSIGVIYRPPNQNLNVFLNEFNHLMHKVNRENKNCYLLSDFNINLLNPESHDLTS